MHARLLANFESFGHLKYNNRLDGDVGECTVRRNGDPNDSYGGERLEALSSYHFDTPQQPRLAACHEATEDTRLAHKGVGDHSIGRFDDESNKSAATRDGQLTQLQYVPLTPKV